MYRILFVDDEPGIRKLVTTILERTADFTVLVADTGERALELLESVPVDLLVTDIAMPGMGGVNLIREVSRRLPKLPICCVTAYPEHLGADIGGQVAILQKPFRSRDLLQTLHGRLDAQQGES